LSKEVRKAEKATSKYDEVVEKEAQIRKELAVDEIKRWIAKIPEDKRDKPTIVGGTKTFTPRQVLEEVEKDTEYGRQFGKMLNLVRIDLAKKEER